MMRIVLDTNPLVSAILSPKGNPAKIIHLVLDGNATLIISKHILKEIDRVFRYPKIKKLLKRNQVSPREVNNFLKKLARVAVITTGRLEIDKISKDPSDNIFLACAIEGQADFIISGDRHLTELKTFKGIDIVDPITFLRMTA